MKNKLWKELIVAVLLISTILSFSPVAYGQTTSVQQSVDTVKMEMKQAALAYVEPAFKKELAPSSALYPLLNSVKKNYEATKKLILASNLSEKEKQAKLKELEALYEEKIIKGLIPYIDAHNYAMKYLEPLLKEVKEAEAKNDFLAVETAYHKLSVQLKSRTAILYRFTGKAPRDLLLERYKKPADATRNNLIVPVTIIMKATAVQQLLLAGKKEEAQKAIAEIQALAAKLSSTHPFHQALRKELERLQAIVLPAPVIPEFPTPPSTGGGDTGGPSVPSSVKLAPGSVAGATAGNKKITGLTKTNKYIVTTVSNYYGVLANGTLSPAQTSKEEAEKLAKVLTSTEIIGLTNGTSYKVETTPKTFAEQFPDPNLASAIAKWMDITNTVNNTITKADIVNKFVGLTSPKTLNLGTENISSMDGFDIFNGTNLEILDLGDNNLTSLDVSGLTNLKELSVNDNQLISLNVSGLTGLQKLLAHNNHLTSLIVSDLTNLHELCVFNNDLASLNVSSLTDLKYLYVYDNDLTSLDVSGLTDLLHLYVQNNQLTTLDVSGLTILEHLNVASNLQLTSLTVLNTKLTSLNVSGLTSLQTLSAYYNPLLTSLDVSGLTSLQRLDVYYNPSLTSLNVDGLTSLKSLDVYDNPLLTSLNVDGLTSLQSLTVFNTSLAILDVSSFTSLHTLRANGNPLLTSLIVSGLTSLRTLYAMDNPFLESLDVNGLTSLLFLYINDPTTATGWTGP